MQISIESEAMKLLINTLLSCRCPLPKELEEEIVSIYLQCSNCRYVDFGVVLEKAEIMGGDNPFNRLKEFITYNINDLGQELFITIDDIYRHYSTSFHWRIVERSLLENYKNIRDIPSWFVGHMLLPAVYKGEGVAQYTSGSKVITLKNLFVPADLDITTGRLCGVHLASVVGILDGYYYQMINRHLEEITLFRLFRDDIDTIDYCAFQRIGNYKKDSEKRYFKYFSESCA